MTPIANPRKVTILSTVHLALDNRVFYREAQTLAHAGYDVTLIAIHDRDEVKDGINILALPRVPRRRRWTLWRKLAKMAVATSADIYHIHDPELLMVTPYLRRKTGRPTIYDIHEANADFIAVKDYLPGWIRRPLSVVFRYLEPLLARGESGLIFADDQIANDFTTSAKPTTTLFNFPSQTLLNLGINNARNIARDPVVLYLGGLERNRGSSLMMAAFAKVLKVKSDSRLLIVGHFMPPELEDELWADAKSRSIDHAVTITGRVPFEEIGSYLDRAKIGWITWQPFPKNMKNIPTKLFEYMAYGLPVVSSDLPSIRPYIEHGYNGLLVEPSNPAAHAGALLRLLQSDAEAIRMGRAGRDLVETKYNWDVMTPRLLALYDEILPPD